MVAFTVSIYVTLVFCSRRRHRVVYPRATDIETLRSLHYLRWQRFSSRVLRQTAPLRVCNLHLQQKYSAIVSNSRARKIVSQGLFSSAPLIFAAFVVVSQGCRERSGVEIAGDKGGCTEAWVAAQGRGGSLSLLSLKPDEGLPFVRGRVLEVERKRRQRSIYLGSIHSRALVTCQIYFSQRRRDRVLCPC